MGLWDYGTMRIVYLMLTGNPSSWVKFTTIMDCHSWIKHCAQGSDDSFDFDLMSLTMEQNFAWDLVLPNDFSLALATLATL